MEEKKVTLYLEERVGAAAAPVIREKLQQIPDDTESIVLDFSNVYNITSAGLRELLICRKKFGDKLKIENVSEEVYKIFEITGFSELLPIHIAEGAVMKNIYLSFKALIKKRNSDFPDRPAVICPSGTYTWADIHKTSQVVASELEQKGIGIGTHVAMCGVNSINWIITFFALQKLGAIAVLLNANMKAEEIVNVAKIGDITHLCYGQMPEMKDEEAFKDCISADTSCPIKSFYSFRDERDFREIMDRYDSVKDEYRSSIDPDFPCVMLFTSGSTGKPKGVLLSAYNLLNASDAFVQALHMQSDDRTCLILPLFHILAQVTFLAGALVGAVTIIPKDIRTSTLLSVIEMEKCTIMNSVPTMLLALLNNKDFVSEKVSSLRCTVIAGAAATPAQIKLFKEKMPQNHFMGAYGLSEMAPVSMTLYEDTEEHITGTVGKPVRNIEIKIFNNEKNADCAVGESGEILVQGYNLMAGYYKVAPDQQSIDEEGYLRTGDLGYLDAEGYLHLSGRLKELIIRGGENIMPLEIEEAVSSIPEIDMVRVFGVPDSFFGEEVCACIKMKDGNEFNEEQVRGILSGKLSKFKVPKYIFCYDELPMLGSGKIDTVTLKRDAVGKLMLNS
ncbi:MAG: AMP-binding protein [Lachnospiraceae bacterium]|nr:AMP-binding protein [Lachnospiraceae bacterium]